LNQKKKKKWRTPELKNRKVKNENDPHQRTGGGKKKEAQGLKKTQNATHSKERKTEQGSVIDADFGGGQGKKNVLIFDQRPIEKRND